MDNQHRMIAGYRELTEADIEIINELKAKAEEVGAMVEGMTRTGAFDQRWVAIGRTHIQEGFMALVRAVAQPETF